MTTSLLHLPAPPLSSSVSVSYPPSLSPSLAPSTFHGTNLQLRSTGHEKKLFIRFSASGSGGSSTSPSRDNYRSEVIQVSSSASQWNRAKKSFGNFLFPILFSFVAACYVTSGIADPRRDFWCSSARAAEILLSLAAKWFRGLGCWCDCRRNADFQSDCVTCFVQWFSYRSPWGFGPLVIGWRHLLSSAAMLGFGVSWLLLLWLRRLQREVNSWIKFGGAFYNADVGAVIGKLAEYYLIATKRERMGRKVHFH